MKMVEIFWYEEEKRLQICDEGGQSREFYVLEMLFLSQDSCRDYTGKEWEYIEYKVRIQCRQDDNFRTCRIRHYPQKMKWFILERFEEYL